MRKTHPDSKLRRNLSKRWYNMVARCTDEEHPRYPQYGGAGITICDKWKDKENFIEDAQTLPGFDKDAILEGRLHLDKDVLDPTNKVYSPDTCVFVSLDENNRTKPIQMTPFIAIAPDGSRHEGLNQSEFAEKHQLRQSTISDCLNGRVGKHRGWTFESKKE